jgi:hypothetical protein
MDRVTVFTACYPLQAQIVCSRLQTAGFNASVEGEALALNTVGYVVIRVQVSAQEALEARNLIQACEENQS